MTAAKDALRPRRVEPVFVERVWGRTDLSPLYGPQDKRIGEVWFSPGDTFPLLVKFIFTSERLSVQVHPGDEYAGRNESSRGKTEMWHILAAEPGASIALGLRRCVNRDDLRAAVVDGSVEQLLNWIPVRAGETLLAPAGVIHAIGAGITLCEIQQNSDVTYRLYDYGRPRELHVDKALDVSETGPWEGRRQLPVSCEYFTTEEISVGTDYTSDLEGEYLLIAVEGRGTVNGLPFEAGEVWHVPAKSAAVRVRADGHARFLRTRD